MSEGVSSKAFPMPLKRLLYFAKNRILASDTSGKYKYNLWAALPSIEHFNSDPSLEGVCHSSAAGPLSAALPLEPWKVSTRPHHSHCQTDGVHPSSSSHLTPFQASQPACPLSTLCSSLKEKALSSSPFVYLTRTLPRSCQLLLALRREAQA